MVYGQYNLRQNQIEDKELRNLIVKAERGHGNGFIIVNRLLCQQQYSGGCIESDTDLHNSTSS